MPFLVEKLEVYQKSVDFADRISGFTESFPKGKYYLADQLNRASLSIPANVAEGPPQLLHHRQGLRARVSAPTRHREATCTCRVADSCRAAPGPRNHFQDALWADSQAGEQCQTSL